MCVDRNGCVSTEMGVWRRGWVYGDGDGCVSTGWVGGDGDGCDGMGVTGMDVW